MSYGSLDGSLIGNLDGSLIGNLDGNPNGKLDGSLIGNLNGKLNGNLNGNGKLNGNLNGNMYKFWHTNPMFTAGILMGFGWDSVSILLRFCWENLNGSLNLS